MENAVRNPRNAGRKPIDPFGVKRERISATVPPDVAEYARSNGGISFVIEAAIVSTPAYSAWLKSKVSLLSVEDDRDG